MKSMAISLVTSVPSSCTVPMGISAISALSLCPLHQTPGPGKIVAQNHQPRNQKDPARHQGQDQPDQPQGNQYPSPNVPHRAAQVFRPASTPRMYDIDFCMPTMGLSPLISYSRLTQPV